MKSVVYYRLYSENSEITAFCKKVEKGGVDFLKDLSSAWRVTDYEVVRPICKLKHSITF